MKVFFDYLGRCKKRYFVTVNVALEDLIMIAKEELRMDGSDIDLWIKTSKKYTLMQDPLHLNDRDILYVKKKVQTSVYRCMSTGAVTQCHV